MTRIMCLLVCVFTVAGVAPAPVTAVSPLEVVLVQYTVSAEDYSSLEQFHDRIAHVVEEAMDQSHPDLIVFPEYASVFALFPDHIASGGEVRLAGISPQVVTLMSSDEDEPAPAAATEAAHQLVRSQAERFSTRITEIWSEVAAEYEVWIIAGSGFVPAPEGGVNNRVWVFDRAGEIAYHQDKVFLTDFERDNLGVVPGTVSEADTFEVEEIELAVTICRDSYFDAWEEEFSAADAWIDVRA
ncbi:MAG: nitrilase-related carbon-nitrogen hydrolase, partial [Alkalispirochaeta sp.]